MTKSENDNTSTSGGTAHTEIAPAVAEPKTKCSSCGCSILSQTAECNDGLCAPCAKARQAPGVFFACRKGVYWGIVGGLAGALLAEPLRIPVFIVSWVLLDVFLVAACRFRAILLGNVVFIAIAAVIFTLLSG